MDKKIITTDDLREMLDKYSPEQQMEIDAKTVSEGTKALADVSAQIRMCLEALPKLVNDIQEATALHISDESITAIIRSGEDTGKAAAKAFDKKVGEAIKDAGRSAKHVSCPAYTALTLLFLLLSLVFFMAMVITLNYTHLHDTLIWKALWISVGFFVSLVALTAFIRYMDWV